MCAMTNSEAKQLLMEENPMGLLPGFRFHPTDEELIVHYLMPKVMNNDFSAVAIGQVDFNKCEPWDLPKVANTGDTAERYYYCLRDKKYPTGLRTNRATKAGYWKATGKDREILLGNYTDPKPVVGMKKTLVFYKGRAPRGEKTNWVMHEFRLHSQFDKIPKDDYGWVVSRVFHKNGEGNGMPKRTFTTINNIIPFSPNQGTDDSFYTDHELIKGSDYDSLPHLIDSSPSSDHQLQDLKPAAFDSYDDDQLLYAADPFYYYPNLPGTLIQTHGTYYGADDSVNESFNLKVEHYFASSSVDNNGLSSYNEDIIGFNAMINSNNDDDDVEIPCSNVDLGNDQFNGFLPSTMGSVQDHLSCNMWTV